MVTDEIEAPLVGVIFDLYARRRLGAHAIAKHLKPAGHRARSGKAWGHTAELTVLRTRAYIGEIYFRGTWYAAPHDPLVDTEVYRQAQVVLRRARLSRLLHTYGDSRLGLRAVRAALDAEIANVDATIERYLQAFEDRTILETRAGDRMR